MEPREGDAIETVLVERGGEYELVGTDEVKAEAILRVSFSCALICILSYTPS